MYLIPWSMCTLHICILHINLCTKCEFSPFWKHIFTIKMWSDFRFILTNGYLRLWSSVILWRWIHLSIKLAKLFRFQNSVFVTDFISSATTFKLPVVYTMHDGQVMHLLRWYNTIVRVLCRTPENFSNH